MAWPRSDSLVALSNVAGSTASWQTHVSMSSYGADLAECSVIHGWDCGGPDEKVSWLAFWGDWPPTLKSALAKPLKDDLVLGEEGGEGRGTGGLEIERPRTSSMVGDDKERVASRLYYMTLVEGTCFTDHAIPLLESSHT